MHARPSAILSPGNRQAHRLLGIDAARGTAMLFVCLAHFGFVYFTAPGAPEGGPVYVVTMLASPTFMLISGMMLGFLHRSRAEDFPTVARTLQSRGVFLLTVGHALIVLSCVPRMGITAALWRGFITDVIGVAIIIGPWAIQRLSMVALVGIACALYAAAFALGWGWHPITPLLHTVDYVLAGPDASEIRANFPLLSWLGLYALGSVVGRRLADRLRHGEARRAEVELAVAGGVSVMVALAVKAAYLALRAAGYVESGRTTTYALTSIFQKFPPSLPYHLLYGGFGLMMTAGILAVTRIKLVPKTIEALATLGRASLFVFLLQFYVYYVGFHYLALPYSVWWPVAFAISVLPLWIAAKVWLHHDLNRVFNITRWWARPRPRSVPSAYPPVPPTPRP